jgi:UPF0716 protein FxsA
MGVLRNWPVLFIAVPLLELYLIIKVGSYIGAMWTVLIVIMTAVIGVQLLRIQGFNTLRRAQENMMRGEMPAMEMMEGIVLAVGGALLITPGFITDTLGFLCLLPVSRRAMIKAFITRSDVLMGTFHGGPRGHPGDHPGGQPGDRPGDHRGPADDRAGQKGRTIEGEFHHKDR